MAGTKIGGLKARDANLANDPNFYAKIGAKGGRASRRTGVKNTRKALPLIDEYNEFLEGVTLQETTSEAVQ